MSRKQSVQHILADARERELRSAELYRLLAARERDPRRRDIFGKLAEEERKHAERFTERMAGLGLDPAPVESRPGFWDRSIARFLGTDAMLRRMEAAEERNIAAFDVGARALEADPDTNKVFVEIEREEQAHARLLSSMDTLGTPATRLESILKGEKWHVSTGTWIGDAIYGVNDGLGAVFGFVSGTAGFTAGDNRHVIFAGLLGMIASALSMGASAFLASRSEAEVRHAEMERERKEIEESPEHEREELALIYQLKGFTEEDARRMAGTIAALPEQFLHMMAQEELGISERHAPNPWQSLVTATVSTAVGGIIPVLPFFVMRGLPAIVASAIVSTLAHFGVGAAKSLVTARTWWVSGLEMTAVGVLMGVVTYALGRSF